MPRSLACLLAAVLLGIGGAMPAHAQIADAVLLNGKVVTLSSTGIGEAVAVHDGKVLAVGPSDAIPPRSRSSSSTRRPGGRPGAA